MRFRHRAPATFGIWMVDVLCCSLGCVILLWLSKHRAAEASAREAKANALKAEQNAAWGSETERMLRDAQSKIGRLEGEEKLLQQLLTEAKQKQTDTQKKADELAANITTLAEKRAVLEKLLDDRVKELETVNSLLAALRKDNTALKDDLKTRTATTEEKAKKIEELLKQVAALTENKDLLDKKLANLAALKTSLEKDLESTKGQTQSRQVKIDDLVAQLAKLNDSKEGVEKLLARRLKEMEELEKKLALIGTSKTQLEQNLEGMKTEGTKKQAKIEELNKATDDLARKLIDAEATVRSLEKTVAMLPKLQDDLKGTRERLTDEEARAKLLKTDLAKRVEEIARATKDYETLLLAKRELEKKLEGVNKDLLESLAFKARYSELQEQLGQKDKDFARKLELLEKLKGDTARLQAAMEHRFAGIALTGEKVVFIVDTSGSMELVDENTPALHKWTGVRDTLVQIMKSMPKLEKFQIVTFAEEVNIPLGKEGEWIDYDPKTSPQKVHEALTKIKPSGGTNLQKGFESAFRMRKDGLDTIYLLSDGLPSDGDGLTPEQDRTIKDPNVRSVILSKHLRAKLKNDLNRPLPGKERVRINSIGFFYESPDVGAFLWALSREHDGSFVGMSKP
jgi:hypothetical protein